MCKIKLVNSLFLSCASVMKGISIFWSTDFLKKKLSWWENYRSSSVKYYVTGILLRKPSLIWSCFG